MTVGFNIFGLYEPLSQVFLSVFHVPLLSYSSRLSSASCDFDPKPVRKTGHNSLQIFVLLILL